MGEKEKVNRLLRKVFNPAFRAVLGREDGIVDVDGRPGYAWARKIGRVESLIIARNRSGSSTKGVTVLVRETTLEGESGYEIIDVF